MRINLSKIQNFFKKYFYIWICILILELNFALLGNFESDFGWHYYLGNFMLHTKHLVKDMVGYNIMSNIPLADHEWLSEIILAFLMNKFGYISLIFISFVGTLIIFYLIYKSSMSVVQTSVCQEEKQAKAWSTKNIVSSQSFTVFSLLLLFLPLKEIYNLRLNNIFLFLAVLIFYVSKLVKLFYKRAILLFIIFLLGTNLHGGTILLFIIPFLLEINREDKKPLCLRLSILILILTVSILINPYRHDFIKLIFDYTSDGSYKKYILDWRTTLSFPLMPLSLLHLSIISFFFTINSFFKKIPWNELFLLIVLFILGLLFRRFYILFALISAPYFASSIRDLFTSFKWKENLIGKFNLGAFIIIFILLFKNFLTPINQELGYPQEAAEYIEKNTSKDSILFNQDLWGGYLLWKMPDRKVFVDGRAPQAKFQDKTIVEEAVNLHSDNPDTISKQLQKFDFDYLLIKKDQSHFSKLDFLVYKLTEENINDLSKPVADNLIKYLNNHKDTWELVYQDDIGLIYKKIK